MLGNPVCQVFWWPLTTRLIANRDDQGWMLLLTNEGQQGQGHPAA